MFTKKASLQAILKNLAKALASVAAAVAIVLVLSGQITATTKSLIEKKDAELVLQNRSQALAALRLELAQVGGSEAKIEAALPPDDSVSDFLAALQSIAAQSSIKQATQLTTPVNAAIFSGSISLSRIDYTTILGGTATTLANYLKGFETLPYFAGINSIDISAPGGWDGNSTITVNAFLYAKRTTI